MVNFYFECQVIIVLNDSIDSKFVGMEAISEKTAIFLDSYIDTSLFDAYGSRACYSLFVKNGTYI